MLLHLRPLVFLACYYFPILFRAFPLLCPTSVLRKGRGKGERGKRGVWSYNGTPNLSQLKLRLLCSVVRIPVLLEAEVGCNDHPFPPLPAPMLQEAQNDTSRSPICVSPFQGTQIDLGIPGGCRRVIFAASPSGSIRSSVPCVSPSPL
jgi:hypothetical protein